MTQTLVNRANRTAIGRREAGVGWSDGGSGLPNLNEINDVGTPLLFYLHFGQWRLLVTS